MSSLKKLFTSRRTVHNGTNNPATELSSTTVKHEQCSSNGGHFGSQAEKSPPASRKTIRPESATPIVVASAVRFPMKNQPHGLGAQQESCKKMAFFPTIWGQGAPPSFRECFVQKTLYRSSRRPPSPIHERFGQNRVRPLYRNKRAAKVTVPW